MRYVLIGIILLTSFFVGGCGDCFVGCGDTSVDKQSSVSTSREDKLNLYITEQSDKLIEHYKDSDVFSHTYSGNEVGTEGFYRRLLNIWIVEVIGLILLSMTIILLYTLFLSPCIFIVMSIKVLL